MELWLREAPLKLVEEAAEAGWIEGVVLDRSPHEKEIEALLRAQDGKVAIPLLEEHEEGIMREATELFQLSNRLVPLLTFKPHYSKIVHHLFRLGIPIACLIKDIVEGWIASKAGASFLFFPFEPHLVTDLKAWSHLGETTSKLFVVLDQPFETLLSPPVAVDGAIISPSLVSGWLEGSRSKRAKK